VERAAHGLMVLHPSEVDADRYVGELNVLDFREDPGNGGGDDGGGDDVPGE
jgi:hypothetical protein